MATWKKIALATGTSAQFIRGDGSLGDGGSSLNGTGYVKASGTTISYVNETYSLSSHNHNLTYQPLATQLTKLAALNIADEGGLVRFNFASGGAGTFSLDTSTYLTSVPAQTFASLTSKPTTLAGYGITDAASSSHTHTSISFLNNAWHLSVDAKQRFYFAINDKTYFGSQNGYVFRSANDAVDLATLTNAGSLTITGALAASNLSGTNTGDQNLSGYATVGHNHSGVYAPVAHTHTDAAADAAGFMSIANFNKLGAISGTNTGDQTNISGNAATATTATNFNNGTCYSLANSVFVDTLESVNTNDWLELTYYGGLGVRIGTGANGSKALYAGSLYDAGNRVYSAGNPQVNISGNAATASSISGYNNPTTAATAQTIVYRDSGGDIYGRYVFASHFNSSTANSENPTIGGIWANSTGDNYLRKSTPAHFISQLGLITTSSIGSQSVSYASTAGSATNLSGLGVIQSTSTGTSYHLNYQIRENSGGSSNTNEIYAPQLAFHWGGVVASSIMMESSGRIAIRNNPGSGYENFIANTIYASSSFQGNLTGNVTGNVSGSAATASNAATANGANGNFYIDDNYGNTIVGNYASTRYQGVFAMGDSYKLPADGTSTGNLYGLAWSHPNAGGVASNLNDHGLLVINNGVYAAAISSSIRAASDMRAPIFYDSNDSSYYLDPNASSSSPSLKVAGNIELTAQSAGWAEGIRINVPNISTWGGIRITRGSGAGNWALGYTALNASNDFTIYSGTTNTIQVSLDHSANLTCIGSLRAPIFYDSNDTSYYVDPNSTSRVSVINAIGNISAYSIQGNANVAGTGNASYHPSGIYSTGTNWLYGTIYMNYNEIVSITRMTHTNGRIILSGHLHIDAFNGNSIYLQYYNQGVTIQTYAHMAFNGHSISGLNTVTASDSIRYSGSVDTNNTFGIYFDSNKSDAYAIFREAGGWSHPYPDLRISFHTGIKLGAHTAYYGTRFYNNSDFVTITASVNDGDNNFRGYYDVIAYASDKRLKHNIQPIKNALSKVKSLTGMTYQWNEVAKKHGWEPDMEIREVGIFAQDVQAVLPEAVKLAPFDNDKGKSKSGENYLTVQYDKLIPLLIEAIKEQQIQINELKECKCK